MSFTSKLHVLYVFVRFFEVNEGRGIILTNRCGILRRKGLDPNAGFTGLIFFTEEEGAPIVVFPLGNVIGLQPFGPHPNYRSEQANRPVAARGFGAKND